MPGVYVYIKRAYGTNYYRTTKPVTIEAYLGMASGTANDVLVIPQFLDKMDRLVTDFGNGNMNACMKNIVEQYLPVTSSTYIVSLISRGFINKVFYYETDNIGLHEMVMGVNTIDRLTYEYRSFKSVYFIQHRASKGITSYESLELNTKLRIKLLELDEFDPYLGNIITTAKHGEPKYSSTPETIIYIQGDKFFKTPKFQTVEGYLGLLAGLKNVAKLAPFLGKANLTIDDLRELNNLQIFLENKPNLSHTKGSDYKIVLKNVISKSEYKKMKTGDKNEIKLKTSFYGYRSFIRGFRAAVELNNKAELDDIEINNAPLNDHWGTVEFTPLQQINESDPNIGSYIKQILTGGNTGNSIIYIKYGDRFYKIEGVNSQEYYLGVLAALKDEAILVSVDKDDLSRDIKSSLFKSDNITNYNRNKLNYYSGSIGIKVKRIVPGESVSLLIYTTSYGVKQFKRGFRTGSKLYKPKDTYDINIDNREYSNGSESDVDEIILVDETDPWLGDYIRGRSKTKSKSSPSRARSLSPVVQYRNDPEFFYAYVTQGKKILHKTRANLKEKSKDFINGFIYGANIGAGENYVAIFDSNFIEDIGGVDNIPDLPIKTYREGNNEAIFHNFLYDYPPFYVRDPHYRIFDLYEYFFKNLDDFEDGVRFALRNTRFFNEKGEEQKRRVERELRKLVKGIEILEANDLD